MSTRVEEALAAGHSPFGSVAEAAIWDEAPVVLDGERSRDLVAAIDDAFESVADRARAIETLLRALGCSDALTATGAGGVLVRHESLLDDATRLRLSDALASASRDWDDAYRASQSLVLLVLLARLQARFRYAASDAALRVPTDVGPNAVAERVVAAIGLLDASGPDDQLLGQLQKWEQSADELVQAESQLQVGRALIRRAFAGDGVEDPRFTEARAAFRRAASVEERTDAALWLEVTDLLARFAGGVPPPADVEAHLGRIRELAGERLTAQLGSAPAWAVNEDRLLSRASEQLAQTASTFVGIAGAPNLGEPLADLAHAASETSALAALDADLRTISGAIQRTLSRAVAISLQIEVAQALAKVGRLLDRADVDADERTYLLGVRAELEVIPKAPKAEGGAARAAAPAPIGARASEFLAAQRRTLGTRTGYPQGDQIFDDLWAEISPKIGGGHQNETRLVMAGLELLVGFVYARTVDPRSLSTVPRAYLFAKPQGLGQDAVEEHVRTDLVSYILASPYAYLLAKERDHLGGRTDVQLVSPPVPPLTFETKREKDDAGREAVRANHVGQAQTYVAVGPNLGFLLVLDLTPAQHTVEPNVADRFWIEHVEPQAGAGAHPDYVIAALLGGNRTAPHERKVGKQRRR